MSNSSIQGQFLQVTVVACINLTRTEWVGKQDPYVCLEYGGQKCRTRVCPDGDKNPTFDEKFPFKLIEGIREINVNVWNRNLISHDYFIARGKILLERVISEGYDDTPSTLLTKSGRSAGELRAILHYENAKKNTNKPEEKPTPPPPSVYQPPPPHVYQPPPPPPPIYQPPPTYIYPTTPPHPSSFDQSITTQLPHSYYCHTCGIFIYEASEYHHHRSHHLHQGYQQESSEWYGSASNQPPPPPACPLPPQQPSSYLRESSQPSAPTEPSSDHYQSYPRYYYY